MTSTVLRLPAASPVPPGPLVRARTAERARGRAVVAVLAAAAAGSFLASVSWGDYPMPLSAVLPAVVGAGDPASVFVVQDLRLPRALTGVLVGVAFALAGALFQALTRNPLGSPDVVGVTAGASTGAVALIVMGVGASVASLAAGALLGGLGGALLIYLLAWRRGMSSYRLVLVGIGIGEMLRAATAYLLTRGQVNEAQQALVWLAGSLGARGWQHVWTVGLPLAVLAPAVAVLGRQLRALQLGEDTARGLGVPVEAVRAALALVAVCLAAVATAAAGPVAFVALVAPAIARRLVRAPLALAASALVGVVLTVTGDLVARTAFGAADLPVGVVTGMVGAPYLMWLIFRANRLTPGG